MIYILKKFLLLIFLIIGITQINGQNRIKFNNRDLFASGTNVAWTRFDQELSNPDLVLFRQICEEIHSNGGNSLRLWLHTTGQYTPQFNSEGIVVGPGSQAINRLQQILDIAWENEIGMMLCLWSHDMMDINRPEYLLDRNEMFLTDTSATRAYINNALIPMVDAVKGHPGILAWEIFNEPEGFSNEFGWGSRRKVPELDINRVVNLCAGAIHRTDPTVLVTNGTWKMAAQTDVENLFKESPESILAAMSEEHKFELEEFYHRKYGVNMTAEEIVYKNNNPDAGSYNYYRDDRLIAAGGDPDGTLDFYTVHYYDDFGTSLSPFHNDKSYWGLDKPLCIGEFFMEDDNGVRWEDKFELLYNTGYAGALTWQWWGDTRANDNAKNRDHSRTLQSLNYMYTNYHEDIVVVPKTGTIYSYTIDKTVAESGDTVTVSWVTEAGSIVTINGEVVPEVGSKSYTPLWTTTYTISTDGAVPESRSLTVDYIPSGRIFHFFVKPKELVLGDTVRVMWRTSKGTTAYLNGVEVAFSDTIYVVPDEQNKTFTLDAGGDDPNSREITVSFGEPGEVNRALGADITASTADPEIPNNDPENIIDGNNFTAWTSLAEAGGKLVSLDLTKNYAIDHIKVRWGDNKAKSYFIYYSTDQNNWGFKYVQLVSPSVDSISLDGAIARYIKLSMTPQNETTPISISEIEVFIDPNINDIPEETIPLSYKLNQNYPNPFNPSTVVSYSIPQREFVQLKVYDLLGREVVRLVNGVKEAGKYEVQFNTSKYGLTSGIYIYQIKAGTFIQTLKMILLK